MEGVSLVSTKNFQIVWETVGGRFLIRLWFQMACSRVLLFFIGGEPLEVMEMYSVTSVLIFILIFFEAKSVQFLHLGV
jgi:hypothetical protein